MGAVVGGIGAALAAWAAWQAAVNSSRAATEARDAMAMAVRPSVEVWVDQWDGPASAASARVWVQGAVSDWPATDVLMQFRLASGGTGSTSTKVLEPLYTRLPRELPYLSIDIGQPTEQWPPQEGDHVDIVVLFSDIRHGASYRLTTSSDLQRYADGRNAVTVSISKPSTFERVSADPNAHRRRPALTATRRKTAPLDPGDQLTRQ